MEAPVVMGISAPTAKTVSTTPNAKKVRPLPFVSFVSGGIAGGFEGFLTYPIEFAKTSVQLRNNYGSNNPLKVVWTVIQTRGVRSLYTGCGSMVIGATGKAGVRFLCFDTIKALLADSNGRVSFARGVLAGMCAGVAESVVALTPTERIKTAMIDDSKGARRFRGGFHAATSMVREKGFSELYRGCTATTSKQAATSAVRMGSYNFLQQQAKKYQLDKSPAATFGMGAVAGTITVYATQPFDTIKTRTQAVANTGLVEACRSVVQDAGIRGFWKGSTMRLGRLVLSGGIIFSAYEQISAFLTKQGL
ncbi:Tricarboxylate transport protein [Fonsecaea erecta]|uniref:Tricarboxylate transport protein n=1 Tax=Fonsecaea erecta TaxID=1367422 RepID=A0A178Z1P1_9EURO|nr:Tricarboxylate transport protein [Fonsecaea erecta]OAP53718.1 Tricarboxylate transport protein [Fonsecaea erecta]